MASSLRPVVRLPQPQLYHGLQVNSVGETDTSWDSHSVSSSRPVVRLPEPHLDHRLPVSGIGDRNSQDSHSAKLKDTRPRHAELRWELASEEQDLYQGPTKASPLEQSLKELQKLQEEQEKQANILQQLAEEPTQAKVQQFLDMYQAQTSHTDLVSVEQTLEEINMLTEEQAKQADVMEQIAEEQANHRKVLQQILEMLDAEATSAGPPEYSSDDNASPTPLPLNGDMVEGTSPEENSASSSLLGSRGPGSLLFEGKTWREAYALLKQRFSSNPPALDAEELRRCTENA